MLSEEARGPVLVLALDRPERRNAMVPALMHALAARLRAVREGECTAVVLAARGPSFCVGADLKWLATLPSPAEGVAELVAAHHEAIRAVRALPVPLTAAVGGAAAGGGVSLALAGDLCVASPAASFTAAYFALGLPPDGGTSAFLGRTLGAARTMELLLTNRRLSAEAAHALGLVSHVSAPGEDVVQAACRLAEGCGAPPAATLLATRALLDSAVGGGLEAHLEREAEAVQAAARRPAFAASLAAFARQPRATRPP